MKIYTYLFRALVAGTLCASVCWADVFCKNKKSGTVSVRKKCHATETRLNLASFGTVGPKGDKGDTGEQGATGPTGLQGATGTTGIQGPAGPQGATGATGASGADGQIRIYGDGSVGGYTISTAVDWDNSPPGNNLQFTDFAVTNGASLVLPSGTVIRCTGNFNNAGTIAITRGAYGGAVDLSDGTNGITGLADATLRAPGPGSLNYTVAAAGELGSAALGRFYGLGALATRSELTSAQLNHPGPRGGSGGGGSLLGPGGEGGGTLVVLAQGTISNSGLIIADGGTGAAGAGGGGGGIIILASPLNVSNGGTLRASGGSGGAAASDVGNTILVGPGGGGGGGLIKLISPSISAGVQQVAGGAAGSVSALTGTYHQGGGGGGAGAGSGARGGKVDLGNPVTPLAAGTSVSGLAINIEADPTSLF